MRSTLFGLWLIAGSGLLAADPVPPRGGLREELVVDSVYLRVIDQVDVPAQVAGLLERFAVQEGDRIAVGDLLVALDAREAELDVERARLDLEAARQLAGSDARLRQARGALEEARSLQERSQIEQEISRQKAAHDVALRTARRVAAVTHAELDRAVAARRKVAESVSENELDHLQLTADKADLEVEQALHDLRIAELTAKLKGAEDAGLTATRHRREAELSQAEEDQQIAKIAERAKASALLGARQDLDRRQIRASIAGEVVTTYRRPGEWVEPGERVLRLLRLDRLRAEGFVRAGEGRRERVGSPVRLVVTMEGREREFSGKVTFVSPEIDPVNEQVLIWAEIENPEPSFPLQPGMRGELRILAKPAGQPARGDANR